MGNKLAVDKDPSSIESIISYSNTDLPLNETFPKDSSYQHLSLWALSEEKDPKTSRREENNSFTSKPIELSKIEKNHFLLDGENVYILLLIFKKELEFLIDQSPFPTGLWGIIESSSNMTPRGLLYAFPVTNDSQNLESFLLSKRDYDDSEFKYMLFIWNGKSSSALLRSHSLMKAFDLDKALSEPELIPFLFNGYLFKDKELTKKGTIKLGDIINPTVEGEGNTPSSEKINNFHETVFLLKWLYPEHTPSNNGNKNKEKKPKKEKVFFKGFNKNFIKSKRKKSFPNNFKAVDISTFNLSTGNMNMGQPIGGLSLNLNNLNNNSGNSNGNNALSNNNQGASGGGTIGANNSNNTASTGIKPLGIDKDKLKLNLNIGEKNSVNQNKIPPKLNFNLNLGKKEEETKNCEYEEEDYNEQEDNFDDEENEDYDDINIDLNTNLSASVSSAIPRANNSNIPKLTVSLKQNVLNNEEINEKSKKKAKEEDALNEIPKITLVETTDKIISQQQQAQGEKEKKEIEALNEDYNLKDGERKKLISEYYSKHLSEIIPEFLYLSSYNAAKNKDLLEKNRITHIINCAQDYCENCFEKESNIQYLSLYLKDHALENIECTFYECIEFIEMVKQKEGRVLVHCIQGISRSVSVVIAYLIYDI